MICLLLMCFVLAVVDGNSKDRNSRVYVEEPLSSLEHNDDLNHDFDHEAFLGEELAEKFDQLPPEESKRRLGIMVDKIDMNKDGVVSKEELEDWIRSSNNKQIFDSVESRWVELDMNNDSMITWEEYKKAIFQRYLDNPNIQDPEFNYTELILKDERRFKAADRNKDQKIDRKELAAFYHPEEYDYMRDIVGQEAMEDIDKNKDGFIDLKEYIDDIFHPEEGEEEPEWVESERRLFAEIRDKNNDGKMDMEETLEWIHPSDYHYVEDETKHLLEEADTNKDAVLTKEEILNNFQVFVGSHVTDFGQALLHDEF